MDWTWLLSDVKAARFRFEMAPSGPFVFPTFPGSMIRGALGHALRKIECTTPRVLCTECLESSDCAYALFFEVCADPGKTAMAGVEAPRPYVLDIDYDRERRIEPPETFSFDIVLIGKAVGYAPIVVRALRKAAEAGLGADRTPHALVRAALIPPTAGELELFPRRDPTALAGMAWPLGHLPSDAGTCLFGSIRLDIDSPLRLSSAGKLDNSLDFNVVFRNALRRSRLIAGLYGKGQPGKVYDELFQIAETIVATRRNLQWRDESRFSNRQGTKMLMGGVTGTIQYEGNLGPFESLLHAAETLHVGKGATLGLGKFRILPGFPGTAPGCGA